MATAKMTAAGEIILPKAVRDAHGFTAGTEFEVIDGGKEIVLKPVNVPSLNMPTKITMEEFRAMIPNYEGPPLTDAMIREAIDAEAIRMWAKFERQSHENADD